jgi:hypothetical protein
MVKQILGGIVGYVATFVCMFIAFTCFYLGMGADRAFQPGSYEVSILWIVLSLIVVFVCALVGGFVASLIGGSGAAKILAGIILVLQFVVLAIIISSGVPNEARTADVPNMVAMSKAQTPIWAVLIQTVCSVAGALVGGSLRKNKLT